MRACEATSGSEGRGLNTRRPPELQNSGDRTCAPLMPGVRPPAGVYVMVESMKIRLSTLIVCLVVTLMPGCRRDSDERKVKQLLAEVNSIMAQQEASLRSIPPDAGEIFSQENLGRFPSNRAQLEAPAREMMRLNESHIERQQEMASKFEEISLLNIDNNFRRYADLQAKVFRKRAEGARVLNQRLAIVLDEAVTDQRTFRAKLEEVNQSLGRIDRETREVEAQLATVAKPSVK